MQKLNSFIENFVTVTNEERKQKIEMEDKRKSQTTNLHGPKRIPVQGNKVSRVLLTD